MDRILSNKRKHIPILVLTISTLIILTIDISISNVADIVSNTIKSFPGLLLFCILDLFGILLIYLFIHYLNQRRLLAKNMLLYMTIYNTAVSTISIMIVVEILLEGRYLTSLLMLIVAMAYGMVIIMIGFLTKKFLIWLKYNKNIIVFFYLISSILIVVNGIISPIFVDVVLLNKSEYINFSTEIIFEIGFISGSVMDSISKIQTFTFNAYYIALWLGTIFLLRFYIDKIGKLKFYVLTAAPIIYFLSYGLSIYQEVYPNSPVTEAISSDFMIPILLYTYSFVACGILFGIAFYILSKNVGNSKVKIYLNCTGVGIIIFIISASATVLQAAIPPYGVPNTLFVGLSAFLILFGLYNSATIIANDASVYKKIKASISSDMKLLESIGKSEYENLLNNKISEIKKTHLNEMKHQTTFSTTDEEMRAYAEEIINELKHEHSKSAS